MANHGMDRKKERSHRDVGTAIPGIPGVDSRLRSDEDGTAGRPR